MITMPGRATGAPTLIDLHAHWTPPNLADALRRRNGIPRVSGPPGEETYHSFYAQRPFLSLEHDLHERLAFMDKHGVRIQVLSLPGLFGMDCLPAQEAIGLLGIFNDSAAEACRKYPDRFLALAALPHRDMAMACDELRRAHAMGLRGAILPADGFASRKLAEAFRPLLQVANELKSHLFIHPGPLLPYESRVADASDAPWLRHIVLATQARLSEVIVTLNLTDFLEPCPDVTLQVANLGGAMALYMERINEVSRTQLGDTTGTDSRLGRCYVDTSSFGAEAIAMAVKYFGAERVVAGTDCPIFGTPPMLQALQDLSISEADRESVVAGNACRIFGLQQHQ